MFCLKATENCLVMSHPRSLSPCVRIPAIVNSKSTRW
jgi:hypothetical protein